MPRSPVRPWPPDPSKIASGKPGAVHDIRKVALWLGHASIVSTEHYLRADPTEKLAVLAAHGSPAIKPGRFRPPSDKLMAVLAAARNPDVRRQRSEGGAHPPR